MQMDPLLESYLISLARVLCEGPITEDGEAEGGIVEAVFEVGRGLNRIADALESTSSEIGLIAEGVVGPWPTELAHRLAEEGIGIS